MRSDQLSHNLVTRISPAVREELVLKAKQQGITPAEFVRRAIGNELLGPVCRALDPYASIPRDESLQHLHDAVDACADPDVAAIVAHAIREDLKDMQEGARLSIAALEGDNPYQLLSRIAGYLQQGSGGLLRAASRIRALRAMGNFQEAEIREPLPADKVEV